jgi:hypothetical protein
MPMPVLVIFQASFFNLFNIGGKTATETQKKVVGPI